MKNNKYKILIFTLLSVAIILSVGFVSAALTATAVNLGAAENYSVFSNVEISSTGVTTITGNIGVGSGVTSTAITGNFALVLDATNDFATSSLVTGRVYAYDYTGGEIGSDGLTPAKITASTGALTTAYNAAMAQTDATGPDLNIGAGTVTAQTLTPGVYTWDSGATTTITGDLTLNCGGDASKVFLFQFKNEGSLQLNANTDILLTGNCQSGNIFWAVSGLTNIMTGAHMEGTVLGGPATTEITMITGSTLNGRLLGQKTIALQANTIVMTLTDNTLPQISYVNITEVNDSSKSQNFIYANVSINETNFKNITFRLYNSSIMLINTTAFTVNSAVNRSFNFTSLADGVYYYNVTVYDIAGNKNQTDTYKITLATDAVADTTTTSHNGGGSSFCSTQWVCTEWTICNSGGIQTRECSYRENFCEPILVRPTETQSCIIILTQEPVETGEEPDEPNTDIIDTGTPTGDTDGVIPGSEKLGKVGKVLLLVLAGLLLAGIIFLLINLFSAGKTK